MKKIMFTLLTVIVSVAVSAQTIGDEHALCPDDNHPHMIDLGLPSGTKWACCNVGASSPEGYGGYYAWGETKEKTVYNPVTYQFATGEDTDGNGWYDKDEIWQNLGSSICGTIYDVAYVKWGHSWQMPSKDQIQELISNCSYTSTTFNGVQGMALTGPNGNKIFLPAAGWRGEDELVRAGDVGDYWSGTQSSYEDYTAYDFFLSIFYNDFGSDQTRRCDGCSVRPVASSNQVADTPNDAFYIYRNDGGFNVFFSGEVNSIGFSHYDADGNFYDDVLQVVDTPDSIYYIPISVIDSVSFVRPKNVMKAGIIDLSGTLWDYLVKNEGSSLYFRSDTPQKLLPKVGDKLATIEMTDIFPTGFFAEVKSVSTLDGLHVVDCSGLELEDVFESYCYDVNLYSSCDNEVAPRTAKTTDYGKFRVPTLSYSHGLGASYSVFSVSGNVTTKLTPSFHITGSDVKDPKLGRLTDMNVHITYDTGLNYDFGISASPDPIDIPFLGGRGEYPVCPAISFFWDFGVFLAAEGSICYSQTYTQRYESNLTYKRVGMKMPEINLSRPSLVYNYSSEARLSLDGTFRGGVYGEIGFKPWVIDKNSDIGGKVSGRLEVGLELDVERGITWDGLRNADRNTALYDFVETAGSLVHPNLTISPYASVGLNVKIGPWSETWTPWKGKIGNPIFQGAYFPHFSDLKYKWQGNMLLMTSLVSHDCLFPFRLGFTVFDEAGNKIKTELYNGDRYLNHWSFPEYNVQISGLSKDEKYTVYPSIKIFDYDMLASPSIKVEPFPVTITDFKVTDSKHQNDSFYNDGHYYDYAFYAATTVELNTERDDITEWGYVYEDPYGKLAHIPLMGKSSPYTDTSYAYYRDTPKATCVLYGYVKYDGDNDYYYGEKQTFDLEYEDDSTCPDGNHPHAIDLGLPSGTKWACCNVGASTPEGYGGYYAWGETSEKSDYTWENYQFSDSSTGGYKNIGSDIAGTSYDVAHVKWGGSWRMPSLEQIQELLNNCTSKWTSVNGTYGREFTGPNGGKVFLPAAGYRRSGNLYRAGSRSFYWSLSQDPDYSYRACNLFFNSGNAYWCSGDDRYHGQSVRPVSK